MSDIVRVEVRVEAVEARVEACVTVVGAVGLTAGAVRRAADVAFSLLAGAVRDWGRGRTRVNRRRKGEDEGQSTDEGSSGLGRGRETRRRRRDGRRGRNRDCGRCPGMRRRRHPGDVSHDLDSDRDARPVSASASRVDGNDRDGDAYRGGDGGLDVRGGGATGLGGGGHGDVRGGRGERGRGLAGGQGDTGTEGGRPIVPLAKTHGGGVRSVWATLLGGGAGRARRAVDARASMCPVGCQPGRGERRRFRDPRGFPNARDDPVGLSLVTRNQKHPRVQISDAPPHFSTFRD